MPAFTVIATTNAPVIEAAINRQYGANHYRFSPTVWFVADVGTTKDIADKLGITNGALGAQGVVLKTVAYSGYATASAWSWLQNIPDVYSNG